MTGEQFTKMIIGGIEKLTLIDFPEELAAIVFTKGCNFRCQFCYNPMLVWPDQGLGKDKIEDHSPYSESDLFIFLKKRQGKLGGVVITGGEPTLHPDLPEFIGKIKALGFKIKLDTNGTNPEILEKLIVPLTRGIKGVSEISKKEPPLPPLSGGRIVDYIAMDIKAPIERYEEVVGVKINKEDILRSIKLITESGIPHEFRTTLVPGLHTKEDVAKMGEMIKSADLPAGASAKEGKWYLQFFKSDTRLVNKEFENKERFREKEMKEMKEIAERYVGYVEIRG